MEIPCVEGEKLQINYFKSPRIFFLDTTLINFLLNLGSFYTYLHTELHTYLKSWLKISLT